MVVDLVRKEFSGQGHRRIVQTLFRRRRTRRLIGISNVYTNFYKKDKYEIHQTHLDRSDFKDIIVHEISMS